MHEAPVLTPKKSLREHFIVRKDNETEMGDPDGALEHFSDKKDEWRS